MSAYQEASSTFGDQPPIMVDQRRRPDRRQVSTRWLAGTLLTGLTSTSLMGIALSAALESHQPMAEPAMVDAAAIESDEKAEKGARVYAAAILTTKDRRVLDVSTMVREGDREIIRTMPFALIRMDLAEKHPSAGDYPEFDPLAVFAEAEDEPEATDATGQIYGAEVETQVSLRVEPFEFSAQNYAGLNELDTETVESLVRNASLSSLRDETVQVSYFASVDPHRFGAMSYAASYEPELPFRIIEENVSIAAPNQSDGAIDRFLEEIIPFREEKPIADALVESDHTGPGAKAAAAQVAKLLNTESLEAGHVLRVGVEHEGGVADVVRLSVYRGDEHLLTVARNDEGTFEPTRAPSDIRAVSEAFDEGALASQSRSEMPTVYDAIYQSALAYGLTDRLCEQLIRMLASELDYKAELDPSDTLTILYSMEEGEEEASRESEILFVQADFGGTLKKYYRFRTADGEVGYYDEEGRSAKPFLLRKPVPTGRFTSSFGARRHPVLGYVRNHWGVDWAAPRGTPILASGDGVVVEAGWSSGYGRQTTIKHANGYVTSYSHQSAIAEGITEGAEVRQGQVIGRVGSTGLSTGNHLHYEVSVNGKRVDPLQIRLPASKTLEGEDLADFERERDRIDALLRSEEAGDLVASNGQD